MLSSCVAISAKPMRIRVAATMPMTIALRRSSGGRPAAARPITTALSPASTRSIMMTWKKAVRNAESMASRRSPARPGPARLAQCGAGCQPVEVTSWPNSQSKRRASSAGATVEAAASARCAGSRKPGPQVVEPAAARRGALDPGGARLSRGRVGGEAGRRIAGALERRRQHPGVLQRHRRPLREEGQHRVAGVAEERDPPRAPARRAARWSNSPQRKAVVDRAEQRPGRAAPSGEGAAQVRRDRRASSSPRRSRRHAPRRRRG